jgi:hypothetical protein
MLREERVFHGVSGVRLVQVPMLVLTLPKPFQVLGTVMTVRMLADPLAVEEDGHPFQRAFELNSGDRHPGILISSNSFH